MRSAKVPKKLVALTKSERYAMLALRKESIEDLSRALAESNKRVSDTLNEIKKNFRIRHKIAAHLGLTYEQVWDDEKRGGLNFREQIFNDPPKSTQPTAPASDRVL